jgi:hypothetical protein
VNSSVTATGVTATGVTATGVTATWSPAVTGGCQYASADYQRLLKESGSVCSMSRRGNCFDNAPLESFFARLKRELVHRYRFVTREETRAAVLRWIEVWYNRKRRHWVLGYISAEAFERQHQQPQRQHQQHQQRQQPQQPQRWAALNPLAAKIGEDHLWRRRLSGVNRARGAELGGFAANGSVPSQAQCRRDEQKQRARAQENCGREPSLPAANPHCLDALALRALQ